MVDAIRRYRREGEPMSDRPTHRGKPAIGWRRYSTVPGVAVSVGALLSVTALVGGSSASTAHSAVPRSKSTLNIVSFVPFSGADAFFGDLALSGCYPAIYMINKAGGALGHPLACTSSDTRGDPVDAVPAANALVAHSSNVAAVFGPSSDEALATSSLLESAHLPTFLMAGLARYDFQTNPYAWRLTPADAAEGFAMAAWAKQKGYTRAAAVFATGTTTEGDAPAAINGFKRLGGKIVANISLTPGLPSYNTEVSQVINAKPQVIFFTAPADTSATFFSEMRQLGSIPPTLVTEVAEEPGWVTAVSGAIGMPTLNQKFVAMEAATPPETTPGWKTFHHALVFSPKKVPNVNQYIDDPFTLSYYDAANLVALAIDATHSTKTSVFDKAILGLATPGNGKIVVHDYATGAKDLAGGKKIVYIGADGNFYLNRFHNVAGAFVAVTEGTNPSRIAFVPAKLMSKAQS